jgi:hypothetical protein
MRTAWTHRLVPAAGALVLACGAEPPTDADRSALEPRFNSSAGPRGSSCPLKSRIPGLQKYMLASSRHNESGVRGRITVLFCVALHVGKMQRLKATLATSQSLNCHRRRG